MKEPKHREGALLLEESTPKKEKKPLAYKGKMLSVGTKQGVNNSQEDTGHTNNKKPKTTQLKRQSHAV